jgi:hypothetical protein
VEDGVVFDRLEDVRLSFVGEVNVQMAREVRVLLGPFEHFCFVVLWIITKVFLPREIGTGYIVIY